MRIGIDARFYGPRTGGGGIGRYVAELVTHLQAIDVKNTYTLFLRKENFHECVIRNARFSKRLVDVPWYSVAEQRVMPREVAAANVEFMHYPHWNVPVFSRVPFVVTIHDLILVEDPMSSHATTKNAFVHGIKYVGFRTVLENAIHRSKKIIAVSDYTKNAALKHFRVQSKKVTVVHNGVSAPRDHSIAHLAGLGVYEPYVLCVGNAYPHKNLSLVVDAFVQFRAEHPDVQLVFAGKRDIFSRRLEQEAEEKGIPSHTIRFVDTPTDEMLAGLYRNAMLFVFPSRIEGFGIPPLEAMTYGTPVAASSSTSLPEILGVHAAYFDPHDVDTLVHIMQLAKADALLNDVKRAAAKRHAEGFSWMNTAKETLAVYENFEQERL